ncbi:PPE family protein [Mycobacteroides abscessus subsp. abscessus]|nr:PPE family protein [Mycobacteroides abscessus subsp. abscessus]
MDLDVSPEWESGASGSGAGPMGFTGAVSRTGTTPVGLTTTRSDEFGDGARAPMLPSTWSPDDDR